MARARSYGKGRVFKHPRSPFWYAAYSVRGRQVRKSTGLAYEKESNLNERKATDKLADFIAEDRETAGAGSSRATYEDLRDALVRDYENKGRRSLQSLKQSRLHNLDPFFKGRDAADINATLVDRYIEKRRRKDGAAPATINRELAALKTMFRLGVEKRTIGWAAVPVIKIKTEANARQGFLDRAQFDLLRAKLPDYLAPLVSWMYATGWRVAEAESLRWADLDEGEGIARIDGSRTKNGEPKSFAFAELDLAREAIEAARAARREGCPWLFHRKGRRLRSFYKAWYRACASVAAKLREDDPESATALLFDKLIPHDMRRSTTRNLIRSGVGEQIAMKITGHKTASTFRRYNITTQEDIRHASKLLNEFMARKPESTGNKGETTSDETPASSQ